MVAPSFSPTREISLAPQVFLRLLARPVGSSPIPVLLSAPVEPRLIFASAADTLNLQPGSRIIGEILLGTSDTINIRTGRDIAWLLTFGCSCGLDGITATLARPSRLLAAHRS